MWSKLWIFTDNGISNGNGGGTLWGSTGLRIFNDNDNCNVNDNDNGISNSGETLRGSTDLLRFCKGNKELRGAAVC